MILLNSGVQNSKKFDHDKVSIKTIAVMEIEIKNPG